MLWVSGHHVAASAVRTPCIDSVIVPADSEGRIGVSALGARLRAGWLLRVHRHLRLVALLRLSRAVFPSIHGCTVPRGLAANGFRVLLYPFGPAPGLAGQRCFAAVIHYTKW